MNEWVCESLSVMSDSLRSHRLYAAAAAAKLLQSCSTLCDPTDGSPPGSPVPGILQARILEWVVISFSNAWKWKVKVKSLSRVRLLATSWTAAYQASLSMGFSRQEYWSGHGLYSSWNSPRQNTAVGSLSLLQGIVPTQGLNLHLQHWQAESLGSPHLLSHLAFGHSSEVKIIPQIFITFQLCQVVLAVSQGWKSQDQAQESEPATVSSDMCSVSELWKPFF